MKREGPRKAGVDAKMMSWKETRGTARLPPSPPSIPPPRPAEGPPDLGGGERKLGPTWVGRGRTGTRGGAAFIGMGDNNVGPWVRRASADNHPSPSQPVTVLESRSRVHLCRLPASTDLPGQVPALCLSTAQDTPKQPHLKHKGRACCPRSSGPTRLLTPVPEVLEMAMAEALPVPPRNFSAASAPIP